MDNYEPKRLHNLNCEVLTAHRALWTAYGSSYEMRAISVLLVWISLSDDPEDD